MSSSLVGHWKVSFPSGPNPDLGPHTFLDGELHLWANDWMALRNHLGKVLVGCYLGINKKIAMGSTILFSSHFTRVLCDILLLPEVRQSVTVSSDPNWLWKVSYSTIKDLDRGCMKAYDGTMIFMSIDKWFILKNAKGEPIVV
jgi:hypothetical protein